MKKLLITLLKISISLAIIIYLVAKARNDQAFAELSSQPKNWGVLALATAAFGMLVMVTHIRWYYLVRALGLPFTFRDALRLGFLGYLFNLAPMGIVGGDLLKAVMLSKHLRGERAKAMATIVADRAIGLYVLFVVATVAIIATQFWRLNAQIYTISMITIAITIAGGIGLLALFIPGMTGGRLTRQVGSMGRGGHALQRLVLALRMYQQNLPMLLATTLMTVGVHVLFILGIYLTACGLYDHTRVAPLAMQFVAAPLSSATAVIPLPLGPFEIVLDYLYHQLGMPQHQGLIVALGYRIISVLIACVGVCYYLGSRQEVAEVMHEEEAEEAAADDEPLDVIPMIPKNSGRVAQ